MKLLLLAFSVVLSAAPIAPPTLLTSCDGFMGAPTYPDCMPGTVVYFAGNVPRTYMLPPSRSESLANEVPTVPDIPLPDLPARPSPVPEPGYSLLILIAALVCMGVIRRRGA